MEPFVLHQLSAHQPGARKERPSSRARRIRGHLKARVQKYAGPLGQRRRLVVGPHLTFRLNQRRRDRTLISRNGAAWIDAGELIVDIGLIVGRRDADPQRVARMLFTQVEPIANRGLVSLVRG